MTITETLRDWEAEESARLQYARAVETHFNEADALIRDGWLEQAEEVAKSAAELRTVAYFELHVP